MKTNTLETGTAACRAPHYSGFPFGLPGFFKLILTVLCVSLVSFTSPSAKAGGADGEYQFVSATGSLTAGGQTLELPQDLLQEIGAIQNGKMLVEDNKLRLNRKAAARIIKQIGEELGIEFETTISGPTKLNLKKTGKGTFTGETTKPIVVTFTTTFEGEDISGNIKTLFKAKVKGKKLTLIVPITGKALGMKLTGEMTIICER